MIALDERIFMVTDELMNLFRDNTVINWHEHVWFDANGELDYARLEKTVEAANSTYMNKIVCSLPVLKSDVPPELFKKCNNIVHKAMKMYPGIIEGMAFVNPGYEEESLEEIDRCINDLGMIGIKLYNQFLISNPIVNKIIEKSIKLDIPILEHAAKLSHGQELQPFTSHGTHFAITAKRYPEAVIIRAHIGGGGDWQWCLKSIAPFPNIFIDISGSVCDEGMIEGAVKAFSAKRILFGTDMSFSSSIGKITGARISLEDKLEILNNTRFSRYLNRGDRI